MKDFVRNRRNVCNAIIMVILFMVCPFCYHMMNFNIKYIPGNIFMNQITNSISEAIAQGPLMMIFMHYFSIKSTFLITFVTTILFYLLIILCSSYLWLNLIPWAVLLTKASISISYALIFIAVTHYFEP